MNSNLQEPGSSRGKEAHTIPEEKFRASSRRLLQCSGSMRACLFGLFFVAFLCAASAQETQIQYLSGHGKDDAVPWEFFCTSGANSGFWTNLPVPSQW